MDIKKFLERIKVDHLAWCLLLALFGVMLWPRQVREAHVLCARLLFHLGGGTYVQGNSPGRTCFVIPNVRFTEKRSQILISRSTNSLEDYALAEATGQGLKIKFPTASPSMTNDPLLVWAAMACAEASFQQYALLNPTNLPPTNLIAKAELENALQFIRLAQKTNPTNGALWVAEAAVHFTEKHNAEALAALGYAVTNLVWTTDQDTAFHRMSGVLIGEGLSQLDAAIIANQMAPSVYYLDMEGKCSRGLGSMIISEILHKNKEQSSALIKFMSDLRGANCADRSTWAYNLFRRFSVGLDEASELATNFGYAAVLDSTNMSFEVRHMLCNRIFKECAEKCIEPGLLGRFIAQNEAYETEKALRWENRELRWRLALRSEAEATAAGIFAILSLAAVLSILVLEASKLLLIKYSYESNNLFRKRIFWAVSAAAIIAGSGIFATAWIGMGIGNEEAFGEPAPLISDNLGACLAVLFVWILFFAFIFFDWKKEKLTNTHWRLTLTACVAYLGAILAMSFFRYGLTTLFASGTL